MTLPRRVLGLPDDEEGIMKQALVVNCSAPAYNLGAVKLASWLRREGWQVALDSGGPGLFAEEYQLVALSVIFSWHAPKAARIAADCRRVEP